MSPRGLTGPQAGPTDRAQPRSSRRLHRSGQLLRFEGTTLDGGKRVATRCRLCGRTQGLAREG